MTKNISSKTLSAGIFQAFPDEQVTVPRPETADRFHTALLADQDALEYAKSRGLSLEAITAFKLGLEIDPQGRKWLAIPQYEKDRLVNIKFRSLPPAEKTFRRISGCRSILFNSDAIEGAQEVLITEGEIDAMTLWVNGFKNVVGVTTGAGSFDPAWIDQLEDVPKIYLVYDPDEPGQKGAREAARRLGYDRCFNIVLPDGLDVNELFKAGRDAADFQVLVDSARQFDIAGIVSFQDGLEAFSANLARNGGAEESGLMTGFGPIDRIIKTGFQAGDLVIISAPPKIGKTSLSLQIATFNAQQDIPALFYCLEMRPDKIIKKIVQAEARSEEIGLKEIQSVRAVFTGKPLYLGYSLFKPDLDEILGTLKAAVRRYGLKLIVFDHLHFLCRSISNQVQEVGLAVQGFKFLAEEMEIPVILIAQPRKTDPDAIMTAQDLKDSSSIFSDCDHLIILHRDRERTGSAGKAFQDGVQGLSRAYSPHTLIRVEASRYNAGGETFLYFHGKYSRFEEIKRKEAVNG